MNAETCAEVEKQFIAIVPAGDDPQAAELLAQVAIDEITTAVNTIGACVTTHRQKAPKSADHVLRIRGALARVLLEGVECWPL